MFSASSYWYSISTPYSGLIPYSSIHSLLGVSQRDVVYLTREPSFNFLVCWTFPLPYVVVPTVVAPYESFKADVNISLAEAVAPFTKTTIG